MKIDEMLDKLSKNHELVFLSDYNNLPITYFDDVGKIAEEYFPTDTNFIELKEVDIKIAVDAYYNYNKEIFCATKVNHEFTRFIHYHIPSRTMMNVDSIKMTCTNIINGKWYIGRTESERKQLQMKYYYKKGLVKYGDETELDNLIDSININDPDEDIRN